MKASLVISTPQRLFISVLLNRDCLYRFMTRIRKYVQNNKTLNEVGSWKRTEMQLRDDKARMSCHDIQRQTAGTWELAQVIGKQPTLCRTKQK